MQAKLEHGKEGENNLESNWKTGERNDKKNCQVFSNRWVNG